MPLDESLDWRRTEKSAGSSCRNSSLTLLSLTHDESKEESLILRNKRLAKCGNGVLSYTDEEKLRLEELLEKQDNTDETAVSAFNVKGLMERLKKIDDLLQAYAPTVEADTTTELRSRSEGNVALFRKLEKKLALLKNPDDQSMDTDKES